MLYLQDRLGVLKVQMWKYNFISRAAKKKEMSFKMNGKLYARKKAGGFYPSKKTFLIEASIVQSVKSTVCILV